jgi:hypothetical protein
VAGKIADYVEAQTCDNGKHYVHGWSGGSNKHHVPSRSTQRRKINWYRLRIAEEERRTQQQQYSRQ